MPKKIYVYLLLNWSLFILILISIPTVPSEEEGITVIDKIIHLLLFFVFAYLFIKIFRNTKLKNNYLYLVTFFASMSFAFTCEFIQRYIPGRAPSFFDLIFGALGTVIVIIYFYGKE